MRLLAGTAGTTAGGEPGLRTSPVNLTGTPDAKGGEPASVRRAWDEMTGVTITPVPGGTENQ